MKTVSGIAYWGNVIITTLFVTAGVIMSIASRSWEGATFAILYMALFGGIWQLFTGLFLLIIAWSDEHKEAFRIARYYWFSVIGFFALATLFGWLGWIEHPLCAGVIFIIPPVLYILHFYYTAKFRNHD